MSETCDELIIRPEAEAEINDAFVCGGLSENHCSDCEHCSEKRECKSSLIYHSIDRLNTEISLPVNMKKSSLKNLTYIVGTQHSP